jgi:phosphoglycerate dehydrogenase-like enzyme
MGLPVVFCSETAWARHGADMRRVGQFELLEFVPGGRVEPADVERIDVAFFSTDLYPDHSANFLRVCLDAPRLAWIHVFSAGVDHPIFGMMLDKGARLTTSSGASAIPIAHHVIMSLLALARDLPSYLRQQAAHEWRPRPVDDLEGRIVGVVGMGPIGIESARLAQQLGMRAVGMRRTVSGDEPCETWTFDRLDELLSMVDDLVLAVPLTAETRGLISERELRLLRPGARLVNVGRGELVDEAAMIDAVRSGHLGGAALDVFATEPLPAESPLWDLPSVIITPHNSGNAESSGRRAGELFVENLGRFLGGGPLRNEILRPAA